MKQSNIVLQKLQQFGLMDGAKPEPKLCNCDHKLQGTGAVFYQSMGILYCSNCEGWQIIKKPVEWE